MNDKDYIEKIQDVIDRYHFKRQAKDMQPLDFERFAIYQEEIDAMEKLLERWTSTRTAMIETLGLLITAQDDVNALANLMESELWLLFQKKKYGNKTNGYV